MRTSAQLKIVRKVTDYAALEFSGGLSRKIIGQPEAVDAIVPYLETHQAGLSPRNRPAGVFLLVGPTGTGKTRTVEVLAEILHGSEKSLLRVDCGEFQMEHEVAKLIGAPPGYLGHRETQPWITQQKLAAVASERSDLSIVLFDEIEKAAPSMMRILLGVLDRGTLRLGDASAVNFERTLVFLTSNAGAREMMREMSPGFGLGGTLKPNRPGLTRRLDRLAVSALRKRFAPEFLNRIDTVVTYRPLDEETLEAILDLQIQELQQMLDERLHPESFQIQVLPEARRFLLTNGAAPEYGARELRRTVQRHLTHPLARMVACEAVKPAATVRVSIAACGTSLSFDCDSGGKDDAPGVTRVNRKRVSPERSTSAPT